MVQKKEMTVKTFITSAVFIILAVAFIGAIATQTNINTERTEVGLEAHALDLGGYPAINTTKVYTVTNAPTGWKTTDCLLESFTLANITGDELTLTDDYTVDLTAGTYSLLNTVNTNTTFALYGANNNTYASYTYCGEGYVSQSWGRTVLDTNVGIFAIAILAIAILLVYSLLGRKEDY